MENPELSYTYEVVEMTPTQFVMRTADGPFVDFQLISKDSYFPLYKDLSLQLIW